MADRRYPAARGPRGWHEKPAETAPRARGRRRRRRFGVLAAIGVLLGALAALVLLLRPSHPPAELSIAVFRYSRQYPPNALASWDSRALGDFFADHRERPDEQEGALLRGELAHLRTRPANEGILLHLSALARTAKGTVYLLPSDADPDDPGSWVPLGEVMDALHDCPARHKVLILDVARPSADARLGILADDVATRLPTLLEPEVGKDPALLFVLLPCSPGEVALASDELGLSVFGHYLVEGLRGKADGYNPAGRVDETVTLDELAEYVRSHVDRWAWENRHLHQIPLLLAKDPEQARRVQLTLMRVVGKVTPQAAQEATSPDALTRGWKLLDTWREGRIFEFAPRRYRELEATLIRSEQQWAARNVDAASLNGQLGERLADIERNEARDLAQVPHPPARSLAVALARGEKPPEIQAVEALRGLAKEAVEVAAEAKKAKDPAAVTAAFQKKLDAVRKPFEKKPFALHWVVFEAAADDPALDADRLRFYAGRLTDWDQDDPRYAETLLLRRLADLQPDRRTGTWPQELVQRALQVARDGEKAIACQAQRRRGKEIVALLEPRALPWVRNVLSAAVRDRREGERRLFRGDGRQWKQADDSLRQADQEYEKALDLIGAVAEAHRLLQDTGVFLPEFAPYRLATPNPELSTKDWDEAVRQAGDMADYLAHPERQEVRTLADLSAVLDDIRGRIRDLRTPLNRLRDRVRDQINALRPERRAGRVDPVDYVEADALLNSSLLTAAERVTLRKAARDLGQQLNSKTQDEDAAETPQHRLAPPAPDPSAPQDEDRRALRRARCQIDLLKLAGLTGAAALDKAATALRPAVAPEELEALGDRCRAACARGLADEAQEALKRAGEVATAKEVPAGLVAADRLCRGIHPFDVKIGGPGDLNPAPLLRQKEARLFWDWIAGVCQEEADQPNAPAATRDFYSRAADDYRTASSQ
jgi:hypothetical protein